MRLELCKLRPDDAEAVFSAYARDLEATKYLTWHPHTMLHETRQYIESRIAAWENGSEFTWAVRLHDGHLIGGLAMRLDKFKADFGYVFAKSFWGQGYATEALQALVDWGLSQPGIFRFWAVCDVENIGSARVLEKVGMRKEGVLHRWMSHPNISATPRDCLCYARVKE